ncbi:MAG: NAD(P)/FAD-dependent oxidoreductase [Methanomicrobiales archaeon]
MKIFDIAVIGAGPAGCMAAIRAAQLGKNVILIERNNMIGRKLLLTGHGRCNFTNTASLEVFMEMFGKRGSFYRDTFTKFSNQDLINFFQKHDLDYKVEESGRVFPITENSKSVIEVLKKAIDESKVKILYNYRLKLLDKKEKTFKLFSTEDKLVSAYNVVIATGGVTYGFTGSSGDGLSLAEGLGHDITKLRPGGIPLLTKEKWVHQLKGVTLEDVGLSIKYNNKIKPLGTGNLLLTHFGVSGPVILNMSNKIVELMEGYGDLKLLIDLKPGISEEALGTQLQQDFQRYSKKLLKNYLNYHLTQSTIEPILKTINLDPQKKLNQITKKERIQLQRILKTLPLTVTGHLPLDKALVTCGGVSKKQINPKTMESNLVNGLYFAGEIISGCGLRGGYNLQQAFSTGYVAGESAAESF